MPDYSSRSTTAADVVRPQPASRPVVRQAPGVSFADLETVVRGIALEVGKLEKEHRQALADAVAAAKAEMRSEMGRFRQQVREEAAEAMAAQIARLERRIDELARPSS